VKHGSTYRSLTDGDDVLTVGLNRAVTLIAEAPARRQSAGRQLGEHPEDGKVVSQGKGRFGPYVKHGKLYATIPADIDPETLTLEQALPLLQAQAEKKAAKGGTKKATTKKAASKKKPAAKKSATKKKSAKKAAADNRGRAAKPTTRTARKRRAPPGGRRGRQRRSTPP
jgi:DNA topoisomerase-1